MELDRFIGTRQGSWQKLEAYLQRAESAGVGGLRAEELRELGGLYRLASADLVYTRTVLQNAELSEFLNQLVASAYGLIYQKPRFSAKEFGRFMLHGFPDRVRRRRAPVLVAAAVVLLSVAVGWVAVLVDRDAFVYIVPSDYHTLYGERPKDLREARFGDVSADEAAAFSGQLYTNNIRVTLMAFAMGISFGVLTIVALFYNGVMLGAIAANFHRWGLDRDFWALILPHGGIEISCIALGGGAGLILAWALIRPGRRTRGQALAEEGRDAVAIAFGTAPWLVMAGFIEAFVTPLAWLGPWPKLVFGIVSGVAFWLYLLLPRGARGKTGNTGRSPGRISP